MERKWTDAQLLAMDTTDKTLLVSAAAGSGKTATLTERIIRRVTDTEKPADVSKMLIVTYTRTAAAELRSRIFAALGEALAKDPKNTHLSSQLMKVGSANICTIDSFYLNVVKANFSSLGLSSSFRIIDKSEYEILSKRVMQDCVDSLYESCPDFARFTECFSSIRLSEKLITVFLKLYSDLLSFPDGIEYVKKCAERTEAEASLDFFKTSYGDIQRKNALDIFEHYHGILKSALEYMDTDEYMSRAYREAFEYDFNYCTLLREAVLDENNAYNKTKALLESYSAISLGSLKAPHATEISACYRDMRGSFKAKLSKLCAKSFSKSQDTITKAMLDTASNLYILYDLLSLFEKSITEEKNRLSVLTFKDVSRATMNILVSPDGSPTDVAKQYAEQFTDIYIDEYQDVDMVQDLIFRSISKENNRFMVGDIKQSIYSFRGAEPRLFSDYRREFPPIESDEAKASQSATIFMSDNFRCDSNVIKFTNDVCSVIFSVCADSIGYTKKDDLVFSKDNGIKDYVSPRVQIALITPPENAEESDAEAEELKGAEREAEYIASEIARLTSGELKADGTPIRPGDIAVLFRAKKISPIIADALRKRGIMSVEADGARYFEDPDVLMMLCILNCVDNPQRDIYLAGALRSPIFNFTMDELILIRKLSDESLSLYGALENYAEQLDDKLSAKIRDFISTLDEWQRAAASLAVDRFIRMLYESDRFIASGLVSQTNSKGEGGNLLMLYEYARTFENGSFKGLYQFIEYINSVIENGGTISPDEIGSFPDKVSLMSIHKSKGLEFPVCFVANSKASVRSRENKDSLVFEYPSGIAMKISAGDGLARVNTPMREAILEVASNKKMEEEMRVLYVALTRARERLYLTASAGKKLDPFFSKAKSNAAFPDRYTVMQECSSYLDWVFLALEGKDDSAYEVSIIPLDQIDMGIGRKRAELEVVNVSEDTALTERLKKEFAFKYKYGALTRVPSKLSVSRLYPDVLDETDTAVTLFDENIKKAEIPEFFSGKAKKATASERGTATHLFLQFCDFERARENGIEEELSRLLEKKFLPKNASELVYIDELKAFMQSELAKLIFSSKRIIREQRFNVELSADGFTSDKQLLELIGEDKLAVQGVIDLITVNADESISLFDYKTDRLTNAELSDPVLAARKMNDAHGLQLSYYIKAVELLFGRKCSRVCVYSTHAARLFEITPQF